MSLGMHHRVIKGTLRSMSSDKMHKAAFWSTCISPLIKMTNCKIFPKSQSFFLFICNQSSLDTFRVIQISEYVLETGLLYLLDYISYSKLIVLIQIFLQTYFECIANWFWYWIHFVLYQITFGYCYKSPSKRTQNMFQIRYIYHLPFFGFSDHFPLFFVVDFSNTKPIESQYKAIL